MSDLMHLQGAPMRRPYSDWLADCERIVERETGTSVSLRRAGLQPCYDVGMSPREAVTDWLDEKPKRSSIWL